MRRDVVIFILLTIGLLLFFVADLLTGAAHVHLSSIYEDELMRRVLLELRMPRALTAVLAGMALSVSGLMMQTLFRNPLAGPSVLGVSSGATLGVAILLLLGLSGAAETIVFAIAGAIVVMLIVLSIASKIRSNVTLLIVGMMVSSLASAIVNVLQNIADPDSLKLFITWTLGSLSAVGWKQMVWLMPCILLGLLMAISLIKPLNGFSLGEEYAASLGIPVKAVRTILVLSSGLLAGAITAFCGPIAFVGVAVPYLARGIFQTSNHRITLPGTMLLGANLLLVCDMLCNMWTNVLPISTVSALFGAPIVLLVVLKK